MLTRRQDMASRVPEIGGAQVGVRNIAQHSVTPVLDFERLSPVRL